MFSKLKIPVRDLVVGLFIVSPLLIIAISSFHPIERGLEKEDENKRGVVNSLSKASLLYKEQIGTYPSDAVALNSEGIIDWIPENPEKYVFKSDSEHLIIYTQAESMAFKEYCSGEDANILYSSRNSRTDLVCGDNPVPGDQKFIN